MEDREDREEENCKGEREANDNLLSIINEFPSPCNLKANYIYFLLQGIFKL